MSFSNLTGNHFKNNKKSAISNLLLQYNCTINFDDFDIFVAENNKFKLLLKEGPLIKLDKPTLNRSAKSVRAL